MSGIAGIFNLNGAPIDRTLLERLTNALSFRGPDAQRTWFRGPVGFGHTLLRTGPEARDGDQPLTLDGNSWIVSDARIDGRRELTAALQARGQHCLDEASDAELILRAYQAWGEQCVDHLIGDFAFAIWNSKTRSLFCARDQMGVKPFYFAQVGASLVFSNTLDCIRLHPAVSDTLNDSAIADFLLFEMNLDSAATSFADIERLPPAHCATWSRDGRRVNRYWTMPIDEPVFYKREADYFDQFHGLLREAVADRLPAGDVGIFLSGGLDSTTIAVTACDLLRARPGGPELRAVTKVDPLHPEERRYAGLAADHLGISLLSYEWGDNTADPDWERTPFHSSEPDSSPWNAQARQDYWRRVEPFSRVFLYGEGPDNALHFEWRPYASYLIRQRRYWRLVRDLSATVISRRRPPFWGRLQNLITQLRSGQKPIPSVFPGWINESFANRLQLRDRWEMWRKTEQPVHPIRPAAYASLHLPLWQAIFEAHDPGRTGICTEIRCPFVDLRMLRFLLALPALPWCRSKYFMRRAMRDRLPASVLRRGKSGVLCSALMDRIGRGGLKPVVPAPQLDSYLDYRRVPSTVSSDAWEFGSNLLARSLNHWLKCSLRTPYDAVEEVYHDDFA